MLKKEIIKKIRNNKRLKNDLCVLLDISYPTLYRWLQGNNKSLTRIDAMRVISHHLGADLESLTNLESYQS
jgi:transcriptional regulator with XRE-family HTH domain